MPDSDPRSQVYQHVKTGGLYVVEHWSVWIEAGWVPAIAYRSLVDGKLVVRPRAEFMDGRFKCIPKDELLKVIRGADEY